MISLASSVQTCMRFAGKQRAFLVPFFPLSFSTPLRSSPPPSSSFLFNRSRPSHGWFYSILLFRKLTPLLPSPFANEKKKKERLAPNGYEYCSRKSPYRSTNGGSFIIIVALFVSSAIFLASSSLPRLTPRLVARATPRLYQGREEVTTSEERVFAGTSSSFVIVRNRDTAFFHGIFSPSMSTNLGEINQRSKECNLDLDGTIFIRRV